MEIQAFIAPHISHITLQCQIYGMRRFSLRGKIVRNTLKRKLGSNTPCSDYKILLGDHLAIPATSATTLVRSRSDERALTATGDDGAAPNPHK